VGAIKAVVKGFIFMFFGILGYVVVPLWILDFVSQLLLKWGVFYPFSPIPVVLLGITAAGTLFLLGLFKEECVGHGMAGVARSLITALWISSFPGILLVNLFYPMELFVRGIGITAVLDVKGTIMLLAYVVAATALIYAVEVAIGLRKRKYLVYS